jgi:hypothetical protein
LTGTARLAELPRQKNALFGNTDARLAVSPKGGLSVLIQIAGSLLSGKLGARRSVGREVSLCQSRLDFLLHDFPDAGEHLQRQLFVGFRVKSAALVAEKPRYRVGKTPGLFGCSPA